MFNRINLKLEAKSKIKYIWGANAIIIICLYLLSVSTTLANNNFDDNQAVLIILLGILVLVLQIPLMYLQVKLAMKGIKTEEKITWKDLTNLFSWDEMKHYFVKTLYSAIFIWLWSLLFIIPGIIKAYEYYFVQYIALEHPELSCKETLQLSKKMTYGAKMNIFIMELSFIGWNLLALITFGLSSFYVQPYYQLAFANLYYELYPNNSEEDEDVTYNPTYQNVTKEEHETGKSAEEVKNVEKENTTESKNDEVDNSTDQNNIEK